MRSPEDIEHDKRYAAFREAEYTSGKQAAKVEILDDFIKTGVRLYSGAGTGTVAEPFRLTLEAALASLRAETTKYIDSLDAMLQRTVDLNESPKAGPT